MSSAPMLTPNGVQSIIEASSGNANPSFQPVFQVLSLKSVGASSTGNQRYRVVLSDGTYFVQGMLATQLNSMVEETNELEANSVIRVLDFMNNAVHSKNVIIVLKLDVVATPQDRIGEPMDIEKVLVGQRNNNGGAGATTGTTSAAAAPSMYQPRTNNNNPYGSPRQQQQQQAHNPYGGGNMNRAPAHNNNNNNSYGNNNSNPYSSRTMNGTSGAPIVHQGNAGGGGVGPNGTPITLISQLNMYQNRWTLKARVVSKSDIRTWSNAKGEGSLFSFELLDASAMDIRATCFKEAVDKFYNYLEVGKVYTFSGGRLKVANAQYNTCKSSMELTFDHQTSEIHLVDDVGDIQATSLDVTPIANIEQVAPGQHVDVLAIVQEVGEVQNLVSKKTGNELQKTDVTLVDTSGVQIRLTLWGNSATTAQADLPLQQVVGVRRARVSDYGGRSLSSAQSLTMNPDVPATRALQQWWATNGSRISGGAIKSLSASSGGAGGRPDTYEDRLTIADIKGRGLGHNSAGGGGDYISFKAHFSFFKKDREGGAWYTACPNKEDPCRNRCKVTQTTDGQWQCDRCHGVFSECNRKWIFSATVADDTASTWVSLFDDQALTLFDGMTADEVHKVYDENPDFYETQFAKVAHSEWIFKCRVKQEMHNDEMKLKTTVVRMDKVDYATECQNMWKDMEKWNIVPPELNTSSGMA